MVVKIRTILLTFDIEEFDLPLEFKEKIPEKDQFEISKNGTEKIIGLLNKNNVKATFFVSAKFAKQYPELIKTISEYYEVGLHCFEHKDDYSKMNEEELYERIKNGKEIVEDIINKKVLGFRAPRFKFQNYDVLKSLKIKYDCSLNPTYIPGRYNNISKERGIHLNKGVIVVPLTVSPILRMPLFWFTFRNLPLIYPKLITLRSKYICINFHPWEFTDIKKFKVPFLIKRNTENRKCRIYYSNRCRLRSGSK